MRSLILLFLVGCCPVTVWDPYAPITSYDGVGFEHMCSWGVAPGGEVVTAAHCIYNDNIGFDTNMLILDMDAGKDYAILTGDHPTGAREYTQMGDPDVGEVACYFDFRGNPNCGHVTAVTDDAVFVVFSTRALVPGDSGSPLQMDDSRGLVGVITTRYGGIVGRAARLPL